MSTLRWSTASPTATSVPSLEEIQTPTTTAANPSPQGSHSHGATQPDGLETSAVLEMSQEVEIPVTPPVRVNAHVLRILLDEQFHEEVREEAAPYSASVTIIQALIPRPTVYSDIEVAVDAAGLEDTTPRSCRSWQMWSPTDPQQPKKRTTIPADAAARPPDLIWWTATSSVISRTVFG